tara:strand:+ start:1110 stop:1745 length:636 start_codon:yes stop_codon:yes gene_type:complete
LYHTEEIYKEFVNTNVSKISFLNNQSQNYLNALLQKNEFGEVKNIKFKFFLYNSLDVFYFISPSGDIVLSKGLVDKFIQTEDILKVVIYECFLRFKYGAFVYQNFPNTGYKTAKDLSKILILNLSEKISLNKWLYQLLKINNVDTSSLLDWVQSKNRNSLEARLISSSRDINLKEEQEIKEYILKNGIFNDSDGLEMQNKSFFRFKRELLN